VNRTFSRRLAGFGVAIWLCGTLRGAENDGQRLFAERIQPVLEQKCFKCHSGTAKKLEGGLHLDSSGGVRRGGDSGPAVVPGKSQESLLVHALRYDGPEMPPDGRLEPEVIADFERWIRMGAPWPEAPASPPHSAAPPQVYDFEQIRRSHWSLQPIRTPDIPPLASPDEFIRTPIDRFVLARLQEAQLSPSPPADRRTLARRAYFDLTGLPPTFAELESFAADQSPDAYERLVDRLLASPRYGERWGRHWLDVARYSDTKGQDYMKVRGFPFAYTYRDYVIRALNNDLPFDQFILQQIAADLLPTRNDPQTLAALGFLTLRNPKVGTHLQIDDQIDTIGRGLLGLTVACARCHDHKYDAVPTADYYSLYGVLASSEEPEELPLLGAPPATAAYAEFQKKYEKLVRQRDEYKSQRRTELLDHARSRVGDYLRELAAERSKVSADTPYVSLGADDLKPGLIKRWREYLKRVPRADHPVFGPWHEMASRSGLPGRTSASHAASNSQKDSPASPSINPLLQEALQRAAPQTLLELAKAYGDLLTAVYHESQWPGPHRPGFDGLLAVLIADDSPTNVPQRELGRYLQRDHRDHLEGIENKINTLLIRSPAAPPRAMALCEKPNRHNPVVFVRGNPSQLGERVPRQFLRLLSGENRQPFRQGSGRLELARAIASPDNPLTARVIANRVWMHHLGRPLVSTPDDFGARSDPPTHPALLDYLARRLIDGGWSLKQLHREIMLSGVYRQGSADRAHGRTIDPENRLYWRINRKRLELEPLRDALLAVSGQLDETMYGQPVRLTDEPSSLRRTVYGHVDRHQLAAIFRTFDFPNPYQSTAQRPQTAVPQQTLYMLNAPFVIEQARAVAARPEVVRAPSNEARIDALYCTVLARRATAEEIAAATHFLKEAEQPAHGKNKLSPWEQLSQVLLMTNEFVFVD